ncbi:MAG: hypothetical protein ABJH98_01570 [Reichenbachiella sp.]|uniref:aldose 1-epimerase n=1 Tax=Reichenbachiella sp. TaxID=2184521 RepID=UPI00329A1BE3
MFKIEKHKLGQFNTVRLINMLTDEYLEVLTDFGAGLNDLVVKNGKNQLKSVIDGYRSEQEVVNDHSTAFKGSKLSPFPNRILNGVYNFNGKSYQLPINEVGANNNLHALLHNQPFEILEEKESENEAILILGHEYNGTDQGYPFVYALKLTYQFGTEEVSIKTEIENTSNTSIPMGDGWHPYFRFDHLDHVQMKMGKANRLSSNFGNQLNGTHGFEQSRAIGSESLDDCFEVKGGERFSLQLRDEAQDLALEIWQENESQKYKYLQIYTPPTRKSIAIEPVTCLPNAFNTGEGLIILKPNEKVSMSFGIKNIPLN